MKSIWFAALLVITVGCASISQSSAAPSGTAPTSSVGASGSAAPSVAPPSAGSSPFASLVPETIGPSISPTGTPTSTPTPTRTPKPTSAAKPNLVITKFELDASLLVIETPFDAVFTVKNTGDGDAGPFTAAVGELNTDAGGQTSYNPAPVDGLAAGASKKVTVAVTVQQAGHWTFTAVADLEQDVAETNEGDNSRDVAAKVLAGLVDMEWVQNGFRVTDSGETSADGRKVNIELQFKNSGTAGTDSQGFMIKINWYRDEDSASGDLFSVGYADDLPPGVGATLTKIDYLPGPGSYTIYAYIDIDGQLPEQNTDNNEASVKLTIN